jgi:hypothetical protein
MIEWIKVSERLPEEDIEVLIFPQYRTAIFNPSLKSWWSYSAHTTWEFGEEEVEKWMFLPNLPKE